jgi:hypothetical protein
VPSACHLSHESPSNKDFSYFVTSAITKLRKAKSLKIQAGSRRKTVNVNETFGYFRAIRGHPQKGFPCHARRWAPLTEE